jgi:hypothetical protein
MYSVLQSESSEIFFPSIPDAIYYPASKTLISTNSSKGKRLLEKKEKCATTPGKIFNPSTAHCIAADSSIGRNVALKLNPTPTYNEFASQILPNSTTKQKIISNAPLGKKSQPLVKITAVLHVPQECSTAFQPPLYSVCT